MQKEWKPNYYSFEAANINIETYKRKATQKEIDYYDLVSFYDNKILIGQYKCYYFNNVWKDLIGVSYNVSNYINNIKGFKDISTLKQFSSNIEASWECKPNGLKIGCFAVEHGTVMQIARVLRLI